ncbi:MAG: flavin reductase family protein [Granulosicoccus sp.]
MSPETEQIASITASAFTSALSLAANGVSVVTTSHESKEAGLTVSSMCSVCADPALLLICVNTENEFCSIAESSGFFAVNIIPNDAVELATVFAGLGDDPDASRFDTGEWSTLTTGAPILTNALVALDCQVDSSVVKGSHRVFFGRVVDIRTTSGEPLIYTDRRFAIVHPEPL